MLTVFPPNLTPASLGFHAPRSLCYGLDCQALLNSVVWSVRLSHLVWFVVARAGRCPKLRRGSDAGVSCAGGWGLCLDHSQKQKQTCLHVQKPMTTYRNTYPHVLDSSCTFEHGEVFITWKAHLATLGPFLSDAAALHEDNCQALLLSLVWYGL